MSANAKLQIIIERPRSGETRTCKACGAAFYIYPSRLRQVGFTGDFCSNKCKGKRTGDVHRGKRVSAEQRTKQSTIMRAKPPRTKQPDHILRCVQCHGPFAIPGKEHKRASTARFCGSRCWYAYLREHPSAHPRWRGGTFPFYGPDWLERARQARKRDNYTCRDCGKSRRKPALDVHHIRPRREFNGDWVRANALTNLVTLCKSCHKKREIGGPPP